MVATNVVKQRQKRKNREVQDKDPEYISYSDKLDSSDTSFDNIEQEYYDDQLVRQNFPTFTSTFLSDVQSNNGKVKYWLKEYPINPMRTQEERRKFIKHNKDNPSLVFVEDQTFPGTEFPMFQILEDKIRVPTFIEN